MKRIYSISIALVLLIVSCPKSASCQSDANDSSFNRIELSTYTFQGKIQNGNRNGLWIGLDPKTDSLKIMLVYIDGYLLKKYIIDPILGPVLMMSMNQNLDTLYQYDYNPDGKLNQITVLSIVNDTLLMKNCIDFCAKEEGAAVIFKTIRITYNYFAIADLTQFAQSVNGKQTYLYYFNEKYLCTLNENGKAISGNKKEYNKIMSKPKMPSR